MTVEIITPSSREEWLSLREPTAGASETPAILRVHPHLTPYEVWARKSHLVPPIDNKRTRRGNRLQSVAVDIIREERQTWIVKENVIGSGGTFYRDLEFGLSCTADAFVQAPGRDGLGVCQIKTVDAHVFRQEWTIDGDIELPPYVAIQAMQEAHLTGASWACVAALVGFDLDMHIIEVPIHAGVIARIKREVPEFLRRVRENDPPDPDFGRDGGVIADIYADDDGGSVDLSGNERVLTLLGRREQCKDFEAAGNEAEKQRKTIDAELIHVLGNATRGVLADRRVIEAKTVRRRGFTVEPTSYRAIKIKQQRNVAA